MKATENNTQAVSVEALLKKDSEAFIEPADLDLQKQIMAAVEREAMLQKTLKPVPKSKFGWWVSALSIVAVASFLSITLIPQWLILNDDNQATPDFSIDSELHKVSANIEKAELSSLSKMTSEKEAIEKDIQSIIAAFSITANTV